MLQSIWALHKCAQLWTIFKSYEKSDWNMGINTLMTDIQITPWIMLKENLKSSKCLEHNNTKPRRPHTLLPAPSPPPEKNPQQIAAITSFSLVGSCNLGNRKCWLLILCNLQCFRINIAWRILYLKISSDQLLFSLEHSVDQAASILVYLSSELTIQVLDSRRGQFDLSSEEKFENSGNCFRSYFLQTASYYNNGKNCHIR